MHNTKHKTRECQANKQTNKSMGPVGVNMLLLRIVISSSSGKRTGDERSSGSSSSRSSSSGGSGSGKILKIRVVIQNEAGKDTVMSG